MTKQQETTIYFLLVGLYMAGMFKGETKGTVEEKAINLALSEIKKITKK